MITFPLKKRALISCFLEGGTILDKTILDDERNEPMIRWLCDKGKLNPLSIGRCRVCYVKLSVEKYYNGCCSPECEKEFDLRIESMMYMFG